MIRQKTRQAEDIRFAIDMKGFTSFMQILESIDDTRDGRELFPRPIKTSEPVQSYGIILFIKSGDTISYFACQRRTTIEFSEIVKCGPRKDKLYHYFSNMTEFERQLLCQESHNNLWKDLLLEESELFNDTKNRVEEIHKVYQPHLQQLISLTKSVATSPPFEFPKGRQNHQQDKTLLGTALRELKEESGIDLGTSVDLIDEISVIDTHKGTDGVKYQTTYYLVRSPEFFELDVKYHLVPNCIEQYCISKDMHDGGWIKLPVFQLPEHGSTLLCDRLENLLFKIHAKLCSGEVRI
jgi:8-oxo-dGTP pyrophosphatase MutT (NUDIX family)